MPESTSRAYIEITLDDKGVVTDIQKIDKALDGVADSGDKADKKLTAFERAMAKASTAGEFFGGILKDIVYSVGRGVVEAFSQSITLSSQFNNAFVGLSSVARAFGVSAEDAKAAATRLSADGLMKVSESAMGLKNLLATGFSLPQATRLMEAFKDSAAFTRQGTLKFGEAIVGATEGLKNQMSQLVDNAGVTKNLSNILVEAGFKQTDLSRVSTDASVRMALYNGILKETIPQLGDAARYSATYTGQMAKLQTQYELMLVTLGSAVTQNKTVAVTIGFVTDAIQGLNTWLTKNANAWLVVSDAVIFFVKGIGVMLNVVDLAQTTFSALQIAFNETAKALLNITITVMEAGVAMEEMRQKWAAFVPESQKRNLQEAKDGVTFLKGAVEGLTKSSVDSMDRSERWGNTLQTARAKVDDYAKQLEKTRGQTVELGSSTEDLKKRTEEKARADEKASKAAAKHAEELAKLRDKLTDIGSIADVTQMFEAFRAVQERGAVMMNGTVIPIWQLTAKGIKQVKDETDTAIASMKKLGQEVPPEIQRVNDKVTDLIETNKALAEVGKQIKIRFSDLRLISRDLSGYVGDVTEEAMKVAMGGVEAIKTIKVPAANGAGAIAEAMKVTFLTKLKDGFSQAGTVILNNLGSTLQAAFEGGGNFMGAVKSLATQVGSTIGGTIGSALGGPLGQKIGSAIGSLAGPVVGMFQKLFGTAGRDAVKEFAQSMGGFDALHAKLNELGASGEALWLKLTQGVGKNNPQQAKAVIEEITKALEAQKASHEALRKAQNDQIGDLLAKIKALGGNLPAELTPYLDRLREANVLTAENIDLIEQLSGTATPTFQQMEEAAKRLGVSTDALGPAFQNAKAAADWQSVIDDLDTLIRGGADMNALLGDQGMQKKFNELVQASQQFGTAIPENMRPWIEKMIAAGTLLDSSGEKITDIGKLKFGETMQTTLEKLNETLKELIKAISEGIPDAIKKIPKEVDIEFKGRKTGDWPDSGSGGRGDGDGETPTEAHTGGYIRKLHTGGPAGRARVLPFPLRFHAGDEVPAILQSGEFVMQRRAVKKIGIGPMEAMNNGQSPLDLAPLRKGLASIQMEVAAMRRDARDRESAERDSLRRALRDALQQAG